MEKIIDESYYDIIISNIMIPFYDTGDNITRVDFRHSLAHLPREQAEVCDLGKYPYNAFSPLLTLMSVIAIEKSGVGEVQRNPYLDLLGRNVIVAVVDTGIDYRHPAFLHKDGTTRILSLWDQSLQEGRPPEGFTYGTEYSRGQINLALEMEDPFSFVPSRDTNGHGTAIASIAAGRPNADYQFAGVAPEADLLIVKMKPAKNNLKKIFFVPEDRECFQASDLVIGLNYVTETARKLNRPVVLCIAMGTSQLSHDGRGIISFFADYLARQPQIGIAVCAGNEANKQRHYFKNVTQPPFQDNVELRIGAEDKLFALEIWSLAPAWLSIEVTGPGHGTTGIVVPELSACQEFDFGEGRGKLWINNNLFEEETGDQLILLRFQDSMPGTWTLRLHNLSGEAFSFHAWLPSGHLISPETFFPISNPDTTLTTPAGTGHPLAVAAYNQLNDSILPESGRGYTRTGVIKPDIAAPGYEITCALPGNAYGSLTGTGAATALAAGMIAMFFEWAVSRGNYTTITGNDVNRLIMRGARRSGVLNYPNNIWGYGRIDINHLFERLTNI